ncbi:DegV family protein [Carnobacterium funditum]|uniref:DegV family protein n=1 Tax=Carnobacterium funditum TaxID=2752 RepID=UPI00054D046B|nr:DegV family protein [Carnobacterium funditum]
MNKDKVAFLVDSGSNVPEEYVELGNMNVIPLKIIYKDEEFIDNVNITAQDVYDRLSEEIPTTSLPSGEVISDIFKKIQDDGFKKVICVTISSGLSGTNNMVRVISESFTDMDILTIDSKNIGIGSGLIAVQAYKYLEAGLDWETIKMKLQEDVLKSKMFFHVPTLEYLQKGGRIGLVASILGNMLNLKPIITCNDEGVYHTVAKIRGSKKSVQKAIDLAVDFAGTAKKYNLAIAYGGKTAKNQVNEIRSVLKEKLPLFDTIFEGEVSPALGVHTGPGLIGIGIIVTES